MVGLYAAALPAEAKEDTIIDENLVEPGTNTKEDWLQAWTDSTDGGDDDGKGYSVGGGSGTTTYAAAAAEPGNVGQAGLNQVEESQGTWSKRNTPRQRWRARVRLG